MALIALVADKGAPGVTTTSVALAAVWPRPVLLAECDPAGGDLVYRLPAADGARLDPRRGLLSLAVSARRGLAPQQVWEHAQKLRGGLDVLVGVTNAEQGAGLDPLWGQVGAALAGLPEADVIADCGRVGPDGRFYDLLARADAVVLLTRASLGDMVRIRDRVAMLEGALRRRNGTGRASVLVVAGYKSFSAALGEVRQVLGSGDARATVLGGIAYEPRSAELLSGEWGGKLDKSLLIRTAREVAAQLSAELPAGPGSGAGQVFAPPAALAAAPPSIPAPRATAPPVVTPPIGARSAQAWPDDPRPGDARPADPRRPLPAGPGGQPSGLPQRQPAATQRPASGPLRPAPRPLDRPVPPPQQALPPGASGQPGPWPEDSRQDLPRLPAPGWPPEPDPQDWPEERRPAPDEDRGGRGRHAGPSGAVPAADQGRR
jgi:hypothetical protein